MRPAAQGGFAPRPSSQRFPAPPAPPAPVSEGIQAMVIENDWLDAIVALPDQLFYNTGISTYVWVVTNHKAERRRGHVQLIDARDLFERVASPLVTSARRSS